MQGGLLLLVDADRRSQKSVTRVATDLGLEVVTCDSARAGVNAACALEPIAIITELELPDADGFWFIKQIREQPTDVAVTPIIVVTHEIDTSSRARTLRAGADVFLQKPIAAADLLAQASALVDMVERIAERRNSVAFALPAVSRPRSIAPEKPASRTVPPKSVPAPPPVQPAVVGAEQVAASASHTVSLPTPISPANALAQALADELEDWSAPVQAASPRAPSNPPPARESAPRSRRGSTTTRPAKASVSPGPPSSSRAPTQRPGPAKVEPSKSEAAPSESHKGRSGHTKPPKAPTVRPPPVKVPAPRVPSFSPAPKAAAPPPTRVALPAAPAPRPAAAPATPARAAPAVARRPPGVAAPPRAAPANPATRGPANQRSTATSTDEDDVIEAENET